MRVLRIADVARAHPGGISRFMGGSGEALVRRGVEVDVLLSEDLVLAPGLRPLRRLAVPWLVAWRVVGRSRGPRRPDAVEIHEPLAAPYAALRRLAPRLLAPCVVMSHGLEERGWIVQRERLRLTGRRPSPKSLISVPLTLLLPARIALRCASRVMVLSTQDAEFLTARRRALPARIARVNGGVDRGLLSAERHVPAAPRLLFVGTWIDRKGVPELCSAWRRLHVAFPGIRLTVAGTFPDDANRVLRDFAPDCRAGVSVVPEVDDAQLLELLCSHDIFVLASWYEGMALSMLEAAAAGLACVVTSVCGSLDVFRPVDPEADGALLVAPHAVDELVATVSRLAGDPLLLARLGAAARRRAAHFTWEHTAAQLLDAYRAAVVERSPLGEADRDEAVAAASDTDLDVCVVLATWRRPQALLRCLAAIDGQTLAPVEVVVVVREDDGETREALASVASGPTRLRIVDVDAPGVVAALNAGLDAAGAAIVAITDDDAAPRHDWLARIDEVFRHRPDIGAVGGRDWIHPDPGDAEQPVVGRLRAYGRLVGNHHLGSGEAREVDVLKGVNLALRRSAVAGFRLDERLRGAGAQAHWELGLCLALKRAGWRIVYDPAVAVDHHPAERFDEERCEQPTLRSLADEVHNETYALLRWLPWPSKVAAVAYGVLVGSRRAPGILVALERSLRGRDRGELRARLLAAERARLEAVGTVYRRPHL